MGDNYRGYRLVGTLPDLLPTVDFGAGHRLTVLPGETFISGPEAKEAVAGSFAAARLGLKVGDRFHPYHGLDYNPAARITVRPR